MTAHHDHRITFHGRPTVMGLTRALNNIEGLFGAYTPVAISTNGSTDPEREEVYLDLETEK